MQQNISDALGRRKGPLQELPKKEINNNDRKKKKSKAKSSSLVRLLATQYSSKATSQEALPTEDTAAVEAPAPPISKQEPPPSIKRRKLDNQEDLRQCPLCGSQVPSSTYEAHMQQELEALDDSDDDWEAVDRAPGNNQNNSNNYRQQASAPPQPPPADTREPKVYILGGAPTVAVPKNPSKLKDMRLQQKPWVPPAKAFNHYSDGGGFIDGEAIGIEVPEVGGGMAWEGMGTTTF